MNKPLLTITIPTYNRPSKIKQQVLSVLAQKTDDVEVIVLDNHSDVVVESLFDDNVRSCVKFIRHPFNIGGDANIARCFEACQSDWIWTLSDDDMLADDAIQVVLNDIRLHPDYIYINYNRRQNYVVKGLSGFIDKACCQYSFLFWMSVSIYNIRLLSNKMSFYYQSLSTMQPGVCLLVSTLSNNPDYQLLLSDKKVILMGDTIISWNRESFVFASMFLFDCLRDYKYSLNSSLFKSIASMCCISILQLFCSDRSLSKALMIHWSLIKRRGLLNSISYDIRHNLSFIIHLFYYWIFRKSIRMEK